MPASTERESQAPRRPLDVRIHVQSSLLWLPRAPAARARCMASGPRADRKRRRPQKRLIGFRFERERRTGPRRVGPDSSAKDSANLDQGCFRTAAGLTMAAGRRFPGGGHEVLCSRWCHCRSGVCPRSPTWRRLASGRTSSPPTSPPYRAGEGLAFEPLGGLVVAYGGFQSLREHGFQRHVGLRWLQLDANFFPW